MGSWDKVSFTRPWYTIFTGSNDQFYQQIIFAALHVERGNIRQLVEICGSEASANTLFHAMCSRRTSIAVSPDGTPKVGQHTHLFTNAAVARIDSRTRSFGLSPPSRQS